jgi:hypothetical protein
MTLAERKIDPANNVLGDRYLCRGGIMFVCRAIGCRQIERQRKQDICWSLGRPLSTSDQSDTLRILCNQAENDVDDLTEMRSGVVAWLKACRARARNCSTQRLLRFRLLAHWRAISADARILLEEICTDRHCANRHVDRLYWRRSSFCRDYVKVSSQRTFFPSLEIQCAAIVNHHSTKPTNIDKKNWRPSDWMYFGRGNVT